MKTHVYYFLLAVNNGLLDTYQLKSLDGLLEAAVEEMSFVKKGNKLYVTFPEEDEEETISDEGDSKNFPSMRDFSFNASKSMEENSTKTSNFRNSKFQKRELIFADNFSLREGYHHVIRCLGFKFDFSIFNSSGGLKKIVKNGKYPGIKETFESNTIPNLFVAGVISHSLDYRKSAGGFIHGFRYTARARAMHHLLEWRNHKIKWPSQLFKLNDLLNVLILRMNEASGPYQMFGVLADIVVLNNYEFTLIEEYPVSLLPRLEAFTGHEVKGKHLIVMVMEYGEEFSGPDKDTFRPDRATGDPLEAHRSNFLHPVLYFYEDLPKESDLFTNWNKGILPKPNHLHHVLEDFLTTWTSQQSHILPLRRFLETVTKKDIRQRFTDSCLLISLTNKKIPLSCRRKSTFGTKILYRPTINIENIS
ncbi:FAD-dependent oxidoreductase domain-containing protein 2 [Armadillidium nasatum]|uniref:FAD-dependent oxidoreductase domain-containing protein 2 n=1 Tax=Armadillidium nasatum TaxID=96803 RepID=A0A5N5TB05_9CRUS|nr:FAD-dependent oxidoreductase domain-containing protein 2 [Armadillidium nasatum]